MAQLIFEHVGDVNFEYPYLCVRLDVLGDPFMEISVTHDKRIQYVLYPGGDLVPLSADDVRLILKTGEAFLPKALEIADSQ